MYHSDYILWNDGLRLRRRNGGNVTRIDYKEVFDFVGIGLAFFQTLQELRTSAVRSFDPPREIIGRFSSNPPMTWTVKYESKTGEFSMSSSSAVPATSQDYLVQESINGYLGGHVMAVFRAEGCKSLPSIDFFECGFEPSEIELPEEQFAELLKDIEARCLWDQRDANFKNEGLLALSPWGFRYLANLDDLVDLIGDPEFVMIFEPPVQHEA